MQRVDAPVGPQPLACIGRRVRQTSHGVSRRTGLDCAPFVIAPFLPAESGVSKPSQPVLEETLYCRQTISAAVRSVIAKCQGMWSRQRTAAHNRLTSVG